MIDFYLLAKKQNDELMAVGLSAKERDIWWSGSLVGIEVVLRVIETMIHENGHDPLAAAMAIREALNTYKDHMEKGSSSGR